MYSVYDEIFSYVLKVLELRDLYSVRACVRACVRHRILRFLPGSAKRPRPGSGALHKVDIVLQTQCDVESILVWYIEQSMSILTDTVRGLSSSQCEAFHHGGISGDRGPRCKIMVLIDTASLL